MLLCLINSLVLHPYRVLGQLLSFPPSFNGHILLIVRIYWELGSVATGTDVRDIYVASPHVESQFII